jgi:hypothetical protein
VHRAIGGGLCGAKQAADCSTSTLVWVPEEMELLMLQELLNFVFFNIFSEDYNFHP